MQEKLSIDTVEFILFAAVPCPPAAPEITNVLSTSCTVRYQLPEDEGNSHVTGYHVQRRRVVADGNEESKWKAVNETPVGGLELIVDQLIPRSSYEFRVAAENEHGTGDFSPPSQSVTCPADPEAERNFRSGLRRYGIYLHEIGMR